MNPLRTGILTILIFFSPYQLLRAQTPVFLNELEKALKEQNKEIIATNYPLACSQLSKNQYSKNLAEKLIEISHELSRSGFARLVWQNLEKISDCINPSDPGSAKLKTDLLSELGAAFYYDNKFTEADSAFNLTLLNLKKPGSGTDLDRAFVFNFLGLVNRKIGKTSEAIGFFEQARSIRIASLGEDHPQVGAVYNNIGLLYKSTGDFENALICYDKAIEIKKKANDKSVYLNYMNMGELNGILGNYSVALDYYRQADSILISEPQSEKLADLYLNLGGILSTMQGYEDANQYFFRAVSIYDSIYGINNEKSARVFQNLANTYNALGDHINEQEYTEKATEILQSVFGPGNIELAPIYNNLGMVYQSHGEYEPGLLYLNKAKKIYQQFPGEQSEKIANTLINIAETYKLLGQPDSAIYNYDEAIAKLEALFGSKHPYLAYSFNSMAQIYYHIKKPEEAFRLVSKAISSNKTETQAGSGILESCLNPGYLFESLLLSAEITCQSGFSRKNKTKNQFDYFTEADSLLSAQRNFLFEKSDKVNFARNSRRLAESSLDCLSSFSPENLQSKDLEQVFRFVEKSKNLVLLQSINENHVKHFSGIPDSVLQKEDLLLSRIHSFSHQVDLEKVPETRKIFEEKLFDYKLEYRKLAEQLENDYPAYYRLKYSEQVPTTTDIQKKMDEQTAVLAYFYGDKSIYRFTILKNKFWINKLKHNDYQDLLTGLRKGISLKLDEVYKEKAALLYKLLIPGQLPDEIRQLMVVPDGGLSLIPFEALLTGSPESTDSFTAWPFLIKKYTISYAPSLALWSRFRESGSGSGNPSLLAMAPVFDKSIPLPLTESSIGSSTRSLHNDHPQSNPGIAPLKASSGEVLGIDSLFRNHGLKSKLFLQSDASEKNFVQTSSEEYTYIHIATHGFVDEKHPELSGLNFSQVPDSGFDNVLYSGEIYNLKLNARLITLSACKTGLGKLAEGEGILGFSRAFLFAGTENLLLSLWKVNDSSTSGLMTSFYSGIVDKGLKLPDALTNAKNRLIADPATAHPYYWAPFILIGEG